MADKSNLETYSRRTRTLKFGSNVVAGTLLFVVILATINYIAYKRPMQLDLTRDKQYTVSEATKGMLQNLQDQVSVTVYASSGEIPADWKRQLQELEALLKRYRTLSDRKLTFVIKNPDPGSKVEEEAKNAGIREQQMQQLDLKSASFAIGYLGFIVQYKGRSEPVPVIKPDHPLEYQLTRAINKVAEVNIPTVAVLAPQGNPMMGEQSPFSVVPQVLQQEGYTVKTLEPGNLNDLTTDVKLLMVFEPEDLSEEALYRIDQFVMSGGNLFVGASGVQIQGSQRGGIQGTAKAPNINAILEHYGLRINADVVEDWARGAEQSRLTERGIIRYVNPFLIEVLDLSEKSPVTAKLPGLAMVYPSSVSPSERVTSGTYSVLARTSPRSKHQTEMFALDPARVKRPTPAESLQSFDMVASVKGRLNSRFATMDPPTLTNEDGTTRTALTVEVKKSSEGEPQVLIAGTGVSFMDQVVGQGGQINAVFLLNVADTVTRGGEFIALRTKQQNVSFLRDFENREAIIAQILVIGGIPLLLIGLGIGRYYMNRARRARYRTLYGKAPAAHKAEAEPANVG